MSRVFVVAKAGRSRVSRSSDSRVSSPVFPLRWPGSRLDGDPLQQEGQRRPARGGGRLSRRRSPGPAELPVPCPSGIGLEEEPGLHENETVHLDLAAKQRQQGDRAFHATYLEHVGA